VGAEGLHRMVCHSQLPSLSRQNIRWMLHPHTLPPAAGQCRSDGWTADVRRAWWGCCVRGGGGMCRHAGGQARLPPVSLQSSLVSPTTPPPPRAAATHGGLSGARARAGGRLGAWRHSLVAGVRLQTKTTLLQYCEQFHALTK